MKIDESTKIALIRKGNELFNNKDIDSAYIFYITANYFAGIEKIAYYYNFEKKNIIKAMQLYKFILKEDSNLGGNIRAKSKLDSLSKSVIKVLRKWLDEDSSFTEDVKKRKSIQSGLNAINNFNNKTNDNTDTSIKEQFYSNALNIKKPVFKRVTSLKKE